MADLKTLAKYFWDSDPDFLDWDAHKDFITRRLLQHGDLQAVRWLRSQLGDVGLKTWIIAQQGGGLAPPQLRYWALILDIQPSLVDEWVSVARETVWEGRR